MIHHFIFIFICVFFIYFFYHSSCRKEQFTDLILKFGTQDFTNPGLLKILLPSLVCHCGFAFTSISDINFRAFLTNHT